MVNLRWSYEQRLWFLRFDCLCHFAFALPNFVFLLVWLFLQQAPFDLMEVLEHDALFLNDRILAHSKGSHIFGFCVSAFSDVVHSLHNLLS